MGITEISGELGVGKSRIFRHLRTLCARGYAFQDTLTDKYHAGAAFYSVARNLSLSCGLIELVRPHMRDLVERLGLTVTLTRLEGDALRVIDVCLAQHSIAIVIPVGFQMAMHGTAHGKIALAFGPQTLARKIMQAPLRALTTETITDPAAMKQEIEGVAHKGWAISRNECVIGMCTLAAPIMDQNSIAVGGLGIVGSSEAIRQIPDNAQLKPLLAATDAISQRLGYAKVRRKAVRSEGHSGRA